MFNLLSNQTKLLKFISNYTEQEFNIVCGNLKLTIESLNINANELLANRRTYGLLLPQNDAVGKNLSTEEPQIIINKQLLLEQENIIGAINTLCLTEAIMVRDNFINCLEVLTDEQLQIMPIVAVKPKSLEPKNIIEKSNISPIRLTEIKQRLAQAVQTNEAKKEHVKNKLNKLLPPKKPTPLAIVSNGA